MTVTHTSNARKIGKYVASLVKGRSDVFGLWVRQRDDMVELWLIVDDLSIDEEREFHGIVDKLIDRFPDDFCDLRVYNTRLMGIRDHRGFVPEDTFRIEI